MVDCRLPVVGNQLMRVGRMVADFSLVIICGVWIVDGWVTETVVVSYMLLDIDD